VTKAALNALTRTLAVELRDSAVLVNAVSPGWTATDMGGSGGRPIAEGAASIVWGVPDDGPPPAGSSTTASRSLPLMVPARCTDQGRWLRSCEVTI
jgi:NAD(P)-dependent dehydrogenase (short-subunit alcohol dehydrogenase family)